MDLPSEQPKETVGAVIPEREKRKSSRKSKDEKSSRKKDEKSLEVVLKSLNNVADPAEKLQLLSKKYGELYDDSRKDASTVKVAEKQLMMLQRERDALQQDQAKAMLTRNRLEELCRELQKQNKLMKEESIQRVREEEEKRKEVSSKFHTTLTEITALMQQNTESNAKLRDENLEMQKQLKSVWEQYGLREQQAEKMNKQIKLEGQLAEAKIAKARLEFEAQRDTLEREKAELGAQLALCQSRCIGHEKTEEALRAQINVYFEKYDEFQNVLNKSNSVYSGFKTEMEKMSKKITRLEKETNSWKQKWETTHKSLLALAAEKQMKDEEVALQARQLAKMQKLCRALLLEKTALEKASGKKAEEVEGDSALIEDTIAAHMAVNDVVAAKVATGQTGSPKAETHKSKKKTDANKEKKSEGTDPVEKQEAKSSEKQDTTLEVKKETEKQESSQQDRDIGSKKVKDEETVQPDGSDCSKQEPQGKTPSENLAKESKMTNVSKVEQVQSNESVEVSDTSEKESLGASQENDSQKNDVGDKVIEESTESGKVTDVAELNSIREPDESRLGGSGEASKDDFKVVPCAAEDSATAVGRKNAAKPSKLPKPKEKNELGFENSKQSLEKDEEFTNNSGSGDVGSLENAENTPMSNSPSVNKVPSQTNPASPDNKKPKDGRRRSKKK